MEITKIAVLKEFQDYLAHALLCCSKNYLMSEARIGYEEEFEVTRKKLELLDEMIEEEQKNPSRLCKALKEHI